MFGQGFLAFAGQYQRGFAAGFVHGLQVAQAVADQPGFGRVGFEAFEDVVNHAGFGFAAVAVVGGGVRAKPDAVDFAARLTDEAVHFGVHFGQVLDGEVFAADAGLVGGDGDVVACLRQEGDGVHTAFDGYPFVYGFDEVVAVLVDDAVAVEDDEFHGCSCQKFEVGLDIKVV